MDAVEIMEMHEDFLENYRAEDLVPMLIVKKDDELTPMVFEYDEAFRDEVRQAMHEAIQSAKRRNPDWAVFMTTSFMKKTKNPPTKRLQEDPTAMEVHVIQVYTPEETLLRVYDKVTLEVLHETNGEMKGVLSF